MDFSFSPEILQEVEALSQFAQDELNADVLQNDRDCRFAVDNWKRCADYGILGFCVPKQYGGREYGALRTVRLLEALGYGCQDTGLTFAINSQMWSVQPAILKFGTQQLCQRLIPRLISGTCGAFGITESESGSDAFGMQMRAEKVTDGYVLNGTKKFVTLAPECELAVVFAVTNPDTGPWGISGFVVERGTNGFSTTETQPKMGLRTTPIGDMHFENCLVPEANRLGPEGAGNSIFTSAMNSERGFILASQLGAMERQLDETILFAKQRQQFQQPIGSFQAVSHRIADMKLRLELGRLIMYRVAWQADQGQPTMMDASLAKLFLSEIFIESSLDSIRNHGARGYLSEFEIERDLRDSIGGVIYSGTSDIQRNIVAKLLGL